MAQKHLIADLSSSSSEKLRIAYLDVPASTKTTAQCTILLIHGFPQTSYQFRHAVPLLAAKGYRCVVPDYRGAGGSSKPITGFHKSSMAGEMIALLDHLGLKDPVHVVGHDIGGMIAYSIAARYPDRVKSVCWGECPLPGTTFYRREKTENAVQYFHFIFHCVSDLAETLVAGKEREYVSHFLNKICYNLEAFSEADVEVYTKVYAQPGAMRCAFAVYRAFEEDAKENMAWVEKHGKCRVPTLILSGAQSGLRHGAKEMALEVTEESALSVQEVEGAGHYIAEENAESFADAVVRFVQQHA